MITTNENTILDNVANAPHGETAHCQTMQKQNKKSSMMNTSEIYVTVPETELADLGKKLHSCIRDLPVLRKHYKRVDVHTSMSRIKEHDLIESSNSNQMDNVTVQSQDMAPDMSGVTENTGTQVTTTFDDSQESPAYINPTVPLMYKPTGSCDSHSSRP
jgi:hypothetical protein